MKKLSLIFCSALFAFGLFAQSPEKMSYQSVIRDSGNELVKNKAVTVQVSILNGSTPVYVERHSATTNTNGLVSIEVGDGTVVSGTFDHIDWADGTYFIKTETDPNGGSNYTISGTSQLLSVPYALHAKVADTVLMAIDEADPVFAASEAAKITATDITNLGNLSGVNTGDQDISGIARNTQAIKDTAAQIRASMTSIPVGTKKGDLLVWDGNVWKTKEIGNDGQVLTVCGGQLVWTTGGVCPPMPFVCGNTVTFTYKGKQVTYGTVESKTGKCWLDRNLGAEQVATASNDPKSYGDYFQWGRGDDGHQDPSSNVRAGQSTTDDPGHGDLLNTNAGDWRSPRNNDLWQDPARINNPCPPGFRVPTKSEWDAETATWNMPPNIAGGFDSPLKLSAAGFRRVTGAIASQGTGGRYWSSTVTGPDAYTLVTSSGSINTAAANSRSSGFSVRCIKD